MVLRCRCSISMQRTASSSWRCRTWRPRPRSSRSRQHGRPTPARLSGADTEQSEQDYRRLRTAIGARPGDGPVSTGVLRGGGAVSGRSDRGKPIGRCLLYNHELHMPLNRKFRFVAVIVALGLAACDSGPAQRSTPPGSDCCGLRDQARPVPLRFQYAGRVAAFREVEVRARVSGILQEKSFVEGATVKEGDVLFRIDPASYEAAACTRQGAAQGSTGAGLSHAT